MLLEDSKDPNQGAKRLLSPPIEEKLQNHVGNRPSLDTRCLGAFTLAFYAFSSVSNKLLLCINSRCFVRIDWITKTIPSSEKQGKILEEHLIGIKAKTNAIIIPQPIYNWTPLTIYKRELEVIIFPRRGMDRRLNIDGRRVNYNQIMETWVNGVLGY